MGPAETLRVGAERLAASPSDPETIASLERLLETPERLAAARLLASAHERAGNHLGLIRAHEVLSEAAGPVTEKLASLKRIAEIHRHQLHQPDLALATLAKGLQLAPGDPALHHLAEAAAVEADSVDVLVDLLGDLLDGAEGPARAALHKQLGDLHARHLSDAERAIEHLRQALAERPEDLEILEGLRRQHEKRGGWAALAEVTEKIARLEPDRARQLVAWRAAAALHETRLHDEESALECWLRVLEVSGGAKDAAEQVRRLLAEVPGHEGARAALERLAPPPKSPTHDLLSALQAFVTPGADRVKMLPELRRLAEQVDALDSLAEVVEGESEKIEDPAELAALLRFVALLREELKQSRQASVVWNDLLAVRPSDPEALEHLSVLLRASGDARNAAEVALRRGRFVEAAEHFVAAEQPGAALQALDQAVAAAGPSASHLALGELQLRRGKLLERHEAARAVEAYTQALRVEELVPEAVAGLERMLAVPAARAAAGAALEAPLRKLGDPRRLVDALEAQLETAAPSGQRLRFIEIAKLWEQAKEPRAALGAQLRAFHLSPSNARVREDLERLAAALDAKEELLVAYEEGLEREPKGDAAARWRRVAELREELGQRDRVLEAWERAAGAAPGDAGVLSGYAAAARARGDLPRLASALRSLTQALPPSPERTEALYELAELSDDSLGDPGGAVGAYRELLSQAPEDRGVLKSLQRLYERTKDTDGLEEALARDLELARKAGSEEVSALALRLGLLKLDRPEEAAAAFQLLGEVLRLEPNQPHALAALGRLASVPGPLQQEAARLATSSLDQAGDFQKVAQLLEAQLASQASPAQRAAILRRLADLHEGPLADPDLAFLAITRALRETPHDLGILQRCLALAEATGSQEDLESLLEELASDLPGGPARAELWRALGHGLDARSQPAEAARAWTQVRAELPADPEATERLAAFYEREGRLGELVDLLQQQAEASAPAQRPAALARLAAAQEKAGQLEAAVSTLHGLFEVSQGPDVLRALERVLGRLGRHPERAEVLRRLAAASGDQGEQAELLLQQARAQIQAGDPEPAVATLSELLAKSPDEPRAIAELVSLAAEPRVRSTALRLLETAFRDPKQGWQRVAVLELLVEARGPEEGRPLREELAALHEALGDLRQAFAWRLRLMAERPAEPGPRAEAERLARAAHLEEELAGAYQDLLERQPPVDLHLNALPGLEGEDRGWLDAAAGALPVPGGVPAPGAAAAFPVLEGVLESAGRFEPLCELLSGRLRAAERAGDAARELELGTRLARIRHRALKDGAGAVAVLSSLLQRHEGNPETIALLEEIMRSGGPAVSQAVAVLASLLERRPGHPEATALLEEVMRSGGLAGSRAAEALEREYQRAGSPRQQVEALEVRVRELADQWAPAAEQADLLRRIADLQEHALHAPVAAFDAVARLIRLVPDDEPALERVFDLAEKAKAGPGLEALLAEVAPRATQPSAKVAILRPLARLREVLVDPAGALECWRALIALRPDDLEALTSAASLMRSTERWDELAGVLDRQLALARDDDERASLLAQLGALRADSLGDAQGAHATFSALLQLRPGHLPALARLDRLCEQLQRWPEQAEVIERRLRSEPGRRIELQLRLAQVRRARLGDPAGALALLGEVLRAQPAHAGAVAELERLVEEQPGLVPAEDLLLDAHRRARNVSRLIPLLDACAARAGSPERRQALWRELADLQMDGERDPSLAFLALGRAYRESPADAALRAKLLEVAEVAEAQDELVALLEEVAGSLGPADAAEVLLVAAGLCEGPVQDPERAVALYRRALERSPGVAPRVWPLLDRVLELLHRWEKLLPVVEARERAASEGPERVKLLLRIATLAGERLDLPARAAEAYRAVLQRVPDHLAAARALEALYERQGEAERLLEILEHLLAHAPADQGPAIRLKLARLCAPADPERAEALCRQLLASDPLHGEAFALLSGLLEDAGRHEDLERLLLSRLAASPPAEAIADLEYRLAELTYRRLGRPGPAAARYRAVLQRSPRHLGALVALSEIHEGSPADRRELAQVLGQLAQVHADSRLQRSCHVRHAEVLAELGDREGALAAARQALDLVPDDEAEIERLRALLMAQDALPEAARALGLAATLHLGLGRTEDAVNALFELAWVEARRGDSAAGAAALETILGQQPANRRAYDMARALYASSGEWAALATLLARFLPNLDGGERLTTLDQLAELHEHQLGDAIDALGWAKQAALLGSGSAPRRERLERLARALHRLEELAATYRQILAAPGADLETVFAPVSLALAAVEDVDLDQVERAEETLRGLLARDRGHAAAIDAAVRMFTRRGSHGKLAEALELRLESPSGQPQAVRVQVLQQLAELWEAKLGDLEAAAGALRRRLEARRDLEGARMLADFHRRHRQWPEALGALAVVRELSPTPLARARAQFEVAEIHEKELADLESSVAAHLEALQDDPPAQEPFRALERLYRKLERPAELLRAYEQRLPHVPRDEKIEILFKSAELSEQGGDPLEADRRLEEVLKLRPTEVRAMEALARLRRAGERWKPLVEILTRYSAVAEQAETRAALCAELGEVCLHRFQDSRGAEKWWRKAIEVLPTHRPALRALGELDQKEGRWTHAADLLERESKLEEDAAARAELLHRAAVLREDRLRDLVGARRLYGLALKSDQDHWASLRRLRALLLQARSWPDYEQNLAHEARRAPSAEERCDAAVELGAHFVQRARDPKSAIDWYRHALAQRPEALEAALPLSDLLVDAQQWAPAAEVLEGAVKRLEAGGADARAELVRRLCQLGMAHHQLRRAAPALGAYGRALELEPDHAAALRGQFQLREEGGRHAEAADALQRLLALHGKAMPVAEQVELGVRLGELCRSLGRAAQGRAAAERALELSPAHPGALRVLVAVCDQLSAFDKSVRYRQQLAGVVEPDERYRLLLDMGALAHQKLSDPMKAIEGYLGALQVRPRSLEVLQRLHVAYRAAGHDQKAADTLQVLLQHPELPPGEWRRETLVLADLLGRMPFGLDRGVEVLEAAFDKDPDFAEAIQALEALIGRARQWKRLDTSYERAIRRLAAVPGTEAAQAALWRSAGEMRRRELRDRAGALAAFEAGARLLPADPLAQETFADLAMEFPPRGQDALAAYQRALPATAHPEKICAAAGQVAERTGDADLAFLAARAAQALATPTAAQAAALAKLAPLVRAPPELRAPVSESAWRQLLLHPGARGPLGDLMALIFQHAGEAYGAKLGDFKLHPKKHAVELAAATHPALRHLAIVARGLGFESLDVFSPFLAVQTSGQRAPHPDDGAGLRVLPTAPFSLVVGEKFLAGMDAPARAAATAHGLAQCRPELALAVALGADGLSLLLEAALSLADERHVSFADPKVLKAERKRLEKAIPSSERPGVVNAIRAYQQTTTLEDFALYLEGVRLTPLRAALFAAGDFPPVLAHFIPQGREGEAAARDLAGFALGGELQALRRQTQSRLIARI